jgi:hypothetical protein
MADGNLGYLEPVQSLSLTTPPRHVRCPGIGLEWTPGNYWMTYPFLQHGVRILAWEPVGFAPGNILFFRSTRCLGEVKRDGPCEKCQILPSSSAFQNFIDQAKER